MQHALDEALAAGAQKVFVVLGSGGEEIAGQINKKQEKGVVIQHYIL